MRFAIGLARANVDHGTGGPFGAVVFDRHNNRLVAPGVSLFVTTNCTVAHAEMVAIILAQRSIEHFDLGAKGQPPHELVTSAEPCAMCLGAISWSGARHVVCGAHHENVRALGFDEGPKPLDWVGELECRGISVTRDVCREEAAEVLRYYAESGGEIYNARGGDQSE